MKKTLLLMRHAKSSWKDEDLRDIERPLNKRGKKDAPMMRDYLKKKDLLPELILSSSAKRASRTAKAIAKKSSNPENILIELDELYLAEPQAYIEQIQKHANRVNRLMVVGHNPGLEALAQMLSDSVVSMPTSTIARIELPIEKWEQLDEKTEGKLKGLWTPKDVKKEK